MIYGPSLGTNEGLLDSNVLLSAVVEFSVVVTTPEFPTADEEAVRDDKDRPVLRGARAAQCDILVTGDRDLLEAGVGDPMIIPPAEYLRRYQTG